MLREIATAIYHYNAIELHLKAVRVRVEGQVQRVGYRHFILDSAQETGVSGYVKNERDGSITIFAQGDEEQLRLFLDKVRTPPLLILVKSFVGEPGKVNPKLKFFQIRFGPLAEELQEGFGAMEKEFRDYRDEFKEFAKRTDESFKTLMDKYGENSEKLTQILETLQKESMETRKELTRAIDTLSELVRKLVAEKAGSGAQQT